MFNVHIQSKLLQRTPVIGTGAGLHRDRKKGMRGGNEGGGPALAGTREYQQSDRGRKVLRCYGIWSVPWD